MKSSATPGGLAEAMLRLKARLGAGDADSAGADVLRGARSARRESVHPAPPTLATRGSQVAA
jgi:hypothetical protein